MQRPRATPLFGGFRSLSTRLRGTLGRGPPSVAPVEPNFHCRTAVHVPVFSPASWPKIAWDLFVGLLIVYSAVEVPLRVAFTVDSRALALFDNTVDALFGVDILLTFLTGFEDPEVGQLVTSLRPIARRYLTSWFALDFVSTFPFAQLFASSSGSLALLRVLRLLRLLKLLRLLRLARLRTALSALDDSLPFRISSLALLSLLAKILFVAHLVSCFWFALAASMETSSTSFVDEVVAGTATVIDNAGVPSQYLTVLYFMLTTVYGIGYGDYVPNTTVERMVIVPLLLGGSLIVGFIVSGVSASADPRSARVAARMEQLRVFSKERKLPLDLRRRLKRYFRYYLDHLSMFDEQVWCWARTRYALALSLAHTHTLLLTAAPT